MLYSSVTFVLCLLVLFAGNPAYGEETPAFAQTNAEQLAERIFDEEMREKFSPERIRAMIERNQQMAQELRRDAHKIKRKAMGTKKIERFARLIRKSLGLTSSDGQLYVFVSHSMGRDLLRSYLLEASWAGAHVIVRGIPAGMDLGTYIRQYMLPLAQGKRGVGIQIDPRLFYRYDVEVAPTIVWDPGTPTRCTLRTETQLRDALGEMQPVSVCTETDGEFWSMQGAVTLGFALRKFAQADAPGAPKRLAVLRDGPLKSSANKLQSRFSGDWKSVDFPGKSLDLPGVLRERQESYESYGDVPLKSPMYLPESGEPE